MPTSVIVFEKSDKKELDPIATFSSLKKMYKWKVEGLSKSYNQWVPSYQSIVYAGDNPDEKGICSMWFDGLFYFKKVPHNQTIGKES